MTNALISDTAPSTAPVRIRPGFVLPSAALTITRRQVHGHVPVDGPPRIGDVLYGEIVRVGQHAELENKSGRIHSIHNGARAVFVYGNRYAPDAYEAVLPSEATDEVDLVARSGLIGEVTVASSLVKDPTRVRLLGAVVDRQGRRLNTLDHPLIKPSTPADVAPSSPRARLVVVVGSAMNAGKSLAAAAACRALTVQGRNVRAAKITGTASLKDILRMNDAGAQHFCDFTHLGYPSTYLLDESELLDIFDKIDRKYANNPRNFWVVELADGIFQRETAMLLASDTVRNRLHKLVFCAGDAAGVVGGLRVLRDDFDLVPDALSGRVSSSPLAVRELEQRTDLPVFNSLDPDLDHIGRLLS